MRSRPSLAAVIATLMAISESPPSSKKLAFRSTEPTPRHCAQMRCNVASIGDLPFVAAACVSAPADGVHRRPVRRGGTAGPRGGCVVLDPMPLPLKGIAGKRNLSLPLAG